MSGIKDFFSQAIDTIDNIAGSDTAKLYTQYKLEKEKAHNETPPERKTYAHTNVVSDSRQVVDSASQQTFSLNSALKYVPYGLALLIPLFFFMRK